LGLKEDIICCVIATRDIVPRAFSCDYSPVAELLRSWGPSWREHSCLAGGATGVLGSAWLMCGIVAGQEVCLSMWKLCNAVESWTALLLGLHAPHMWTDSPASDIFWIR
jgi:hypothetical protein